MLLIDTREKPQAIEKITDYLQQNNIRYDRTKLYFGDYMNFNNPRLVIDRKHSLAELASNCASKNDRARFRRELERVKECGAHLVLLVEQKKYSDRGERITINDLEDIVLWTSPHCKITGEQVFRTLSGWLHSFPLSIEFCEKRDTGRRICEILEVKP